MSDTEDDAGDKPYEASPRKLEEARKKGEIVRSQDSLTLVSLTLFIMVLMTFFANFMPDLVGAIREFVRSSIISSKSLFGEKASDEVRQWMNLVVFSVFLVPAVMMIAVLIFAKQMIFTPSKLEMKLSRLSIVSNAKKKFGVSGLFEFAKTSLKFFVFSLIFAFFLYDISRRYDGISLLSPNLSLQRLYAESLRWFLVATLAYVAFSIIDLAWQFREHAKKNRMSHKELKDEQKNEEGDEMVRQQRRAKAEEIATNRMLIEVPKASVVITNPTHFAVALKWSGDKTAVPECVARGKDETASRIREVAIQSGVPLFRDPPTARDLYANVKLGAAIDQDHYKAVAIAISYAQRIKAMAAQNG